MITDDQLDDLAALLIPRLDALSRLEDPPPLICKTRDCGEPTRARGLCGLHYNQWTRKLQSTP